MSAAEWDKVFQRQQWGQWPDTRFVEWCMRTFGASGERERENIRFLELGCGFGAQLKFLWAEGFYADGLDGSQTAVDYVHAMPGRRGGVARVDLVTEMPEADEGFLYDCIVDVCCLQHIPPGANAQLVQKARAWLKPGGYMFSKHAAHRHDRPAPPRSGGSVPEPYLMPYHDIQHVFPGFDLTVDEEVVTTFGPPAEERRHWIITGRKV